MGLRVGDRNAFTNNKYGLQGDPFPFGVSCKQREAGVFSMSLFPQGVVDMIDLLDSLEICVVFGVDHYMEAPNSLNTLLDLAEIVASEEIDCTVVDANTIAISPSELTRLLSFLGHYNLSMFDMPKNSNQDKIIMNVLNYDVFIWGEDNTLLPHLAGSSVLLESHDDCYLYLESYDVALLQRVFERALQIYVGTVLIEEISFNEIEVGEVPSEFMEALWPVNSALTILRSETEISESEVRIGVSRQEFNFRGDTQEYPTDIVFTYNRSTRIWHSAEPHQSVARYKTRTVRRRSAEQ